MTLLAPPTSPGRYGEPPARARRFTVDEYHRLIEERFFAGDERFELLEGWIVQKVSRNPPHDSILNRARRRIERALPPGWMVRVQSAVTTADSEPEPDIAVVRGDDSDYAARHPTAADAAAVIEVANTSLADDRSTKLRIYARAQFPEFWIIDIEGRVVEVYVGPTMAGAAYQTAVVYRVGQAVPLRIGGTDVGPIPVADLVG